MTWSAWVNETTLQPNALLYSRTDGTNTVQIGVDSGIPFVAVTNTRPHAAHQRRRRDHGRKLAPAHGGNRRQHHTLR